MSKITPAHHKQQDKEIWQLMIDTYGKDAFINFAILNSFKYRMRAGYKDDIVTDINKALWYEDKIKELKK